MEGLDGVVRQLAGGLLEMFGMATETVEAAEVLAPEPSEAPSGEYVRVLAGARPVLGINDR